MRKNFISQQAVVCRRGGGAVEHQKSDSSPKKAELYTTNCGIFRIIQTFSKFVWINVYQVNDALKILNCKYFCMKKRWCVVFGLQIQAVVYFDLVPFCVWVNSYFRSRAAKNTTRTHSRTCVVYYIL